MTNVSQKRTHQNEYFHVRVNKDFKKKIKLLSQIQETTISEIIRSSVNDRVNRIREST